LSAAQLEGSRETVGPSRRTAVAGLIAFLVIALAGLAWAKWDPYFHKALAVAATHRLGVSILSGTRPAPPEPSLGAAVGYALAYFQAIWTALVAGLLVAAAVEALLPRRWLRRVLSGEGRLGALAGGLLAVPCMMCTCCSAPAAVSLRRAGVAVGPALAWWVGNPALNPAVIVFAAFVLPWPWAVLRLAAGVALVLVVVTLVARLAPAARAETVEVGEVGDLGPRGWGDAAGRYLRSLGRLSLTLLPEYLVIVLLLGAFRGWLFPVAHGLDAWGPLAVVVLAVAGTLFVIPTAGEIPIVQGLLQAGIGVAGPAALLITLPAVSLPSLAMVWRSFPPRVSVALAGSVAFLGVLTAAAASLLIRA
jgi:uncharacterized membrane protein YraQ (UPF0718 family)